MKTTYRAAILVGLLSLLTACGGGGSSSSGSSSSSSSSGGSGSGSSSSSPANVAAMAVNAGPSSVTSPTFNIPSVTITVCEPSSPTTCATINTVLVDTGSSGLRLLASVLSSSGVTLPAEQDSSGNTIYECYPFADGYSWGSMVTATVQIAGESTSAAVPVQVINDSSTPSPAAPSQCTGSGLTSMNSVSALNANGVLGIGPFVPDCGSSCTTSSNTVYFMCPTPTTCSYESAVADGQQASNPVASFKADNNGVIVELPTESAAGAATASGSLIFGIGTESNNTFSASATLTVDADGNFTTSFEGLSLTDSFIDSGSNALFFPTGTATSDAIALCASSGAEADFYCPADNPVSSPLSLTATNTGQNGTTSTVTFQIASLTSMNTSNFALPAVAGPANSPKLPEDSYFDWGLPFFYGRNVYVAINGMSAGGTTGPFYAY